MLKHQVSAPLPSPLRWLAIGLNALLLLVEVVYLLPRWAVTLRVSFVDERELVMVALVIGAAILNLTLFLDYYRRGLVSERRRNVIAGNLRPLPAAMRWGVIALNVLALFSESVLLLDRGINVRAPLELFVVSLMVGAPLLGLAMFLDFNRRGL